MVKACKRGLRLASYRLYCLDGAGKIMTAEWLEADSNTAALDQMRER
jgi:hypothetical protein